MIELDLSFGRCAVFKVTVRNFSEITCYMEVCWYKPTVPVFGEGIKGIRSSRSLGAPAQKLADSGVCVWYCPRAHHVDHMLPPHVDGCANYFCLQQFMTVSRNLSGGTVSRVSGLYGGKASLRAVKAVGS